MIDALGSNARCGSDVLIVKELSTTSVGAADERVVAPSAASAHTSASIAVSGSSQTARRTGDRLTIASYQRGKFGPLTLLDDRTARAVGSANGRRSRGCPRRLEPARGGAIARKRDERRRLGAAAVEGVRTPRVETAAVRRTGRIRNLARQRLW